MKFAFCNELCEGYSFRDTCGLARELGYEGIELAPFTLAPRITEFSQVQRRELKKTARDHGLEIVGLHWLLAKTEGFHINHPDDAICRRTLDYYRELIRCCADLGGKVMVHGSPQQRNVVAGDTPEVARRRTVEFFEQAAKTAAEHDVTLCLEPLGPKETSILTTVADAAAMIEEIDHPNVQLILDCKAMVAEEVDIPEAIREYAKYLRHFHANDDNRSYPGSGSLDFKAILAALRDVNYAGFVSIEVFDFTDSPRKIASRGLQHLKRCL